ncbi:photosynthetic complex assembly protein PuhC [Alteriqipengyuania sp. 357]
MSLHHDHDAPVLKVPLALIAGIAVLAILLAASVSFGLVGRDAVPQASRIAAGTQETARRSLYFHDAPDGAVLVSDAATGEAIARVEPGTGGFVRSTMRGLVLVRKRAGIGPDTPFELTGWEDGGLTLSDPATGESRELVGFGESNRAAFAVLLEQETA